MILDSSAVHALLREEPGHQVLYPYLEAADGLAIGAPTLFETSLVALRRYGDDGVALVERFLGAWEVEVIPFDERHWHVATGAFARYGKGRHPAALNFGDCFSYATASVAGKPLLFVGADFARTDIPPA